MTSPRKRWIYCAALATFLLSLPVFPQDAQPAPLPLQILARYHVPGGKSHPTDIRWASANSIYLARASDGVTEVTLDRGLTRVRRLTPDTETLSRFREFEHIGASPGHLVFASLSWYMAWRALEPQPDGMVRFDRKGIGLAADLDLSGDRLLLLGTPSPEPPSKGEIAWLGNLSSGLTDLRPVLHDPLGPSAPQMDRCGSFRIGAVRFLTDGSFVVVPGFQPGAYLFSAAGAPIRTWTNEEIGLTSRCFGMSDELNRKVRGMPSEWAAWINQQQLVDEILPLPTGPGLIVRSSGQNGRPRWQLKVLSSAGIVTFEIPILGGRPLDRLRGDVREGKIVLLLANRFCSEAAAHDPAEIIVAELPHG